MTMLQRDIEQLAEDLQQKGYIGEDCPVTKQVIRSLLKNAVEEKRKAPRFSLASADPATMCDEIAIQFKTPARSGTAHINLACLTLDAFNRLKPDTINIAIDDGPAFRFPIHLKDEIPSAKALIAYYQSPLPYKDFNYHTVPPPVALKNVVIDRFYSQYALAFSADLYIGGERAARVYNSSRKTNPYPTATRIRPCNPHGRQLVDNLASWLRSVPFVGAGYKVVMLSCMHDLLAHHAVHVLMPEQHSMFKEMKHHIVTGVPGSYAYFTTKTDKPISELLKTDDGRASLIAQLKQDSVRTTLTQNIKILNNNIPADIMRNAGVPEKRIMQYPPGWKLQLKNRRRVLPDERGPGKKMSR